MTQTSPRSLLAARIGLTLALGLLATHASAAPTHKCRTMRSNTRATP